MNLIPKPVLITGAIVLGVLIVAAVVVNVISAMDAQRAYDDTLRMWQ